MAFMEIAIEPVGGEDPHMHELVAHCVRVVEESGLSYRVGPMSTVVQGDIHQLLDLAAKMHDEARKESSIPRIMTTIRLDDTRGTEHTMDDRVKIVEQVLASEM